MPSHVAVIALDGVLDSALGVTADILSTSNRIAGLLGRPAPFIYRLLSARRFIVSGTGRRIDADGTLAATGPFDVIVLLGINVPLRAELEAALERDDVRAAGRFAVRHAKRGALVCASCSATFICAEAGLLDGEAATTSWWLAPLFRARYPRVTLHERAIIVPTRRVVTAGAALSQIDLMLWLVRHTAGPEVAELCVRTLVIDERPSQASYALVDQLAHDSHEVRLAEMFMRDNLERRLSIAEVARAARTSPRTLARRLQSSLGLTPVGLLQRLRVEQAAHLLTTTDLAFEEVAVRVGYEDPGALRRLLHRELGTTARELRRSRVPR